MAKKSGELNSKNLPFDKPGAGLALAGINERNLFARFKKLYDHRTEKEGGSKQAWENIVKNTDKSLARSKSPIALEFKKFLDTGKLPDNPSPQFTKYAAESLDYGIRENTRAQQHKQSFLTSPFGKILGMAGQIGLGFVPGIGPALAATLGGTLGAMNGGGIMGGFTGALQGYGAGNIGSGFSNVVKSTGGWAASLSNPGTFGLNLLDKVNPFSTGGMFNPVGTGDPFSGAFGALNGANRTFGPGFSGAGAAWAPAASNAFGPFQPAVNAGKNAFNQFNQTVTNVKNGINTATGGLSGTLGNAAQTVGNVRDGVSTVTNALGGGGGGSGMAGSSSGGSSGIFETLFGSKGSSKASETLYKQLMALYGDAQAKPFDIRNPQGAGVDMSNGYAKPTLSPGMQRTFTDFDALINKTGSAARNLNQRGLSREFFDQIDRLESRRDANQFNSLESKLFNKSGINTGTANNVADFRNQLEEGRQKRVFQATTAAQDYTTNMFKNFLALNQGRTEFNDNAVLEPLRVASNISNGQQQGRAQAGKFAYDAFGVQAQSDSNQSANDGSLIDDAIQFMSLFGN